ncbi:hypothetical protein G6F50_015465 [Rhizopus delemar]|uniref:Uncharacterized protein n=1 Tax=Rhizopus delemar TaxID=936053 RepID=A0A9P6XY86_9FUNG|nr:hypothetical protein G6F50_015465 [Rhizopus delemar]
MDDQTSNFSTNQSDVRPVLCGPIRRPNDQIVTKVRLVDSGSSRYPYGCVYHPVEEVSASVHQPSLEFDYSGSSQNHSRTASSGDSSGAILAQRDMVSPGTTSGSDGSLAATSTIGSNNITQDASPVTTAKLDALRVEIIRNKLALSQKPTSFSGLGYTAQRFLYGFYSFGTGEFFGGHASRA